MSADDVREMIALAVKNAGTQAALARMIGCSQAHLSDILLRRREPGPKILRAMGLRRVTTYEARKK